MAFRDGYDPATDRFVDLYIYALRNFGPTADSIRNTGTNRGKKLGKRASRVRHLLRELAVYADWDTLGDCFPSEERLSDALAAGRGTVSGWIQDAKSVGWLEVVEGTARKGGGRGWNANRYQLVLPADIREQAEVDARARRESLHPQMGLDKGRSVNREAARRESLQAQGKESIPDSEDVGFTGEDVGKALRGCRESTDEDVGKADTNPSEEPINHPPKELIKKREDVESGLESQIRSNLPRARLNIIAIHGGTEGDVRIGEYDVGLGIEVNAYKKFCRASQDPPDIIASAIAFLPEVTGLEPPISLARWGAEKDGPGIYEQCVSRAYGSTRGKNPESVQVEVNSMPRMAGADALADRRALLRAQVEQLRAGADSDFDTCADCGRSIPSDPSFAVNRCTTCAVVAGREERAAW